jgi:hypothetical protein
MAKTYQVHNYAQPTTAAPAPVTTGTAIKTLLQIATPSTEDLTVIAWGIDFDGTAAAAPIKVELIDTDVAATVTAHVASGIVKWNAPNDPGSLVTLGTTATGYTATAEGTVGATSRLLAFRQVPPNGGYEYEFPLDVRPKVAISRFLRIRVTAAAAVNASCWVRWTED